MATNRINGTLQIASTAVHRWIRQACLQKTVLIKVRVWPACPPARFLWDDSASQNPADKRNLPLLDPASLLDPRRRDQKAGQGLPSRHLHISIVSHPERSLRQRRISPLRSLAGQRPRRGPFPKGPRGGGLAEKGAPGLRITVCPTDRQLARGFALDFHSTQRDGGKDRNSSSGMPPDPTRSLR
jgi:hypothetical protein